MDQVTMTILMLVICFALMYFLTIRPQKKKDEELRQMMEALEVGDSVLTTSGFYGVVVDKVDETTIIGLVINVSNAFLSTTVDKSLLFSSITAFLSRIIHFLHRPCSFQMLFL